MGKLREVEGTYGSGKTPSTIFIYEERDGGSWYAAEGSKNVNKTYDTIEEGVDIEELSDVDTSSASKPINSLDDLGAFMDDEEYAKGGTVTSKDLSEKIKKSGKISEQEINLIKNRMNAGKLDTEGKELVQWIWDNQPELTDDQSKKGRDFLMNLWKSPRGVERKNNPFGYREQEILETSTGMTLDGFHDISKYGGREFYVPIYSVSGKLSDGSGSAFQYYYDGKVNIIGAKGGEMGGDKKEVGDIKDLFGKLKSYLDSTYQQIGNPQLAIDKFMTEHSSSIDTGAKSLFEKLGMDLGTTYSSIEVPSLAIDKWAVENKIELGKGGSVSGNNFSSYYENDGALIFGGSYFKSSPVQKKGLGGILLAFGIGAGTGYVYRDAITKKKEQAKWTVIEAVDRLEKGGKAGDTDLTSKEQGQIKTQLVNAGVKEKSVGKIISMLNDVRSGKRHVADTVADTDVSISDIIDSLKLSNYVPAEVMGKGGSMATGGEISDDVKNHNDFLNLINKWSRKYRVADSSGWSDDESPYSKGFVTEGEIVNVTLFKQSEKGKPTFYFWRWKKKFSSGGSMATGGGVETDLELVANPDFKYQNIISRWLEETSKDSNKYKVAVLLMSGENDPAGYLGIEDNRYPRILRSLDSIDINSKHEMAWRTENYTISEAERWATESLKRYFVLKKPKSSGGSMATGGGDKFNVFVDGKKENDYPLTKQEADELEKHWKGQGYDVKVKGASSGGSMATGGEASGRARDRKYTSQQEHELNYKNDRKSRVRYYQKGDE